MGEIKDPKLRAIKEKYFGKGAIMAKKEREELEGRIVKGKRWLVENLEHPDFEKWHSLYMQLVDEYKAKYKLTEPEEVLKNSADEIN